MNLSEIMDVDDYFLEAKGTIFFTLNLQGQVISNNKAYGNILKYKGTDIGANLINPTLDDLLAREENGLIFDGYMTLRRPSSNSSYRGKVYRNDQSLIFLCEYDGGEIEDLYVKMSEANQKVNNTNRELVKIHAKLKKTILELHETQAMLIHSERMNAMGHLVSGIAHEVNNPIGFVMGNLHVAEDYYQSIHDFIHGLKPSDEIKALKDKYDLDYILEDLPDLLASTLHGADRVSKIVAELRNFSRIDGEDLDYCEIKQCIEEALIIARPQMDQKKIQLELTLDKTTPIECFAAQLNQSFLNLFINAIQAIDGPGTIKVRLWEDNTEIHVTITDNGSGISSDNLPHIFDAFFTTKPPGSGQGLGLNIVYKIITDMHHGAIRAESTEGTGTTLFIDLPKDSKLGA